MQHMDLPLRCVFVIGFVVFKMWDRYPKIRLNALCELFWFHAVLTKEKVFKVALRHGLVSGGQNRLQGLLNL